MQLRKVYFDAYKSLLGKELEISDNCIGLVGINESGKSNVLSAIGVLSPQKPLTISDTPKMARDKNPTLRFEFQPNDEERTAIADSLAKWLGLDNVPSGILSTGYTVVYHVTFDRKLLKESRHFTVQGASLPAGTFVLKAGALTDRCMLKRGEAYISIKDAILTNEKEIQINEKLVEQSSVLRTLQEQIKAFESELKQNVETLTTEMAKNNSTGTEQVENVKEFVAVPKSDIAKKQAQLDATIKKRDSLIAEIGVYNVEGKISEIGEEIHQLDKSIQETQTSIGTTEMMIAELQKVEKPDEVQSKELASSKTTLQALKTKLESLAQTKKDSTRASEALRQPVREKYTTDLAQLSCQLGSLAQSVIETHLPKVVLWKYSDDFILQGQTEFDQIKEAQSLDQIPRPLLNLFRIGLGIRSMEDLKTIIAEIQSDSSERRRYEAKIDKEINAYIHGVWKDYDQKLKISLEQERILVQFYDPLCDFASYFIMQERSQGCRTFISFLLTIGAEAREGVIRDTVLLLDEPETHLHPSGVRFMLQELKKAATNGNTVVFATHSIFMIDRECYNRHIMLTKEKELTIIQPSSLDKIGFFMQEEVLYSTLDIDLNKDFDSTNRYNFVFEGDGDARLFHHFYDHLAKKDQPFAHDMTSFYQGGKCSSIRKYFTSRPIQLGSRWVFILDNDKPAEELRSFLEGRYKDFVNEYIFVFQYEREGWTDKKIEFEDLLPEAVIKHAINVAAEPILQGATITDIDEPVNIAIPFDEYFRQVSAKTPDPVQFKAAFKTALNRTISEEIKETKTKAAETFSTYVSWANAVIERIRGSLKVSARQSPS